MSTVSRVAPGPAERAGERLRFGPFVLDTVRGELERGGTVIPLQPLVYRLLCHLVQHAGAVCSRDELLEAVWKTPHVSDSVLASAMRKLRQALGDSDSGDGLLKTLHGRGYRFDAEVLRASSPAEPVPASIRVGLPAPEGGLALPQVVNRTGDAQWAWVGVGLVCLIHARLSMRTGLRLVPLDTSLQWPGPHADPGSAATFGAVGAAQALVCALSRVGGQLQLDADHVDGSGILWQWRQAGDDPAALAFGLADSFAAWIDRADERGARAREAAAGLRNALGAEHPVDSTMFWLRELGRAMSLERLGQVEQALEVLGSCLPHLGPDTEVALLHARLLRQRQAFEPALAVLQAAHAGLQQEETDLHARLLIERATVRYWQSDFDAARSDIEAAIALCVRGQLPGNTLSSALLQAATLDYRQGEFRSAYERGRQAQRTAEGTGDPVGQVRALLMVATATYNFGDWAGSRAVVDEAVAAAERSGLALLQADAYSRKADFLETHFELDEAIEIARRASRLAQSGGDLALATRARTMEVLALCEAGRAEEARRAFDQLRALPVAALTERNLRRAEAAVQWISGNHEAAIQVTEQSMRSLPANERIGLRQHALTIGRMCLALGDRPRARAALVPVISSLPPLVAAMMQAAMALADGDRRQAVTTLATACATQTLGEADGWKALMSLVWLLAEDGDMLAIEHLRAELAAVPANHPGPRLLRALVELRAGARTFELAQWRLLVHANPGLVNRHAWLMDEAACTRWLAGDGPRLGELFALAWA